MRMNAPPVMNGGETNKEKEDEKVKAVLVLEDGTRYEGYSFGAMSNTSGEIGLFILFYTEFGGGEALFMCSINLTTMFIFISK